MRKPRPKPRIREVYFVQGAQSGLIKIGVANCAEDRFVNLRTGSAEPLVMLGVVLCPNYGELERDLHARFNRHRVRGEWFSPAADLLTYISENKTEPHMLLIEHVRLGAEVGGLDVFEAVRRK